MWSIAIACLVRGVVIPLTDLPSQLSNYQGLPLYRVWLLNEQTSAGCYWQIASVVRRVWSWLCLVMLSQPLIASFKFTLITLLNYISVMMKCCNRALTCFVLFCFLLSIYLKNGLNYLLFFRIVIFVKNVLAAVILAKCI